MLEVISIIMLVSVRSLHHPNSPWTPAGDRAPRLRICKDRIYEQVKSHQGKIWGARRGGGEAGNIAWLSGAKCAECS